MKLTSLVAFVVLLVLGALVSQAVEGASKGKAKQGDCPFIRPAKCLVFEPPQCHSDWQCPKKQKCCDAPCGVKCMDPVGPSQPVKVNPGKCPVFIGQCMTPNPRNYCLNDSHCLNNLKCCKGVCGNSCVKPE
ncbi:secretory leukocyte peptidase inhibitor [Phyllostomus discolor]|uniref:Antileukoproteinase n=1 Tax=Phyllostomus discolor TaxID=89673 RepID=A0A6J2MMX1_9CHIR|nr:antileukoproteinase [Phyllostomus discolor]KAF6089399.1 secretory leukocyte peptidase inhibitor [Phyllostomus discolor]